MPTFLDISFSIEVKHFDYDHEELYTDHSDTYTWSGKQFESRPQRPMINERKKRQLVTRKRPTRKDEPELGSLVIVDTISILDNYLKGPPRRPFNNQRTYFVLLVRLMEENWKIDVENLLEKLWRDYGIINVILLTPCGGDKVLISLFYLIIFLVFEKHFFVL